MENKLTAGQSPVRTEAFLKKRRFYVVFPLLVIPFVTMAFWALGGGKDAVKANAKTPERGIDLALPSAQFHNSKPKDKMAIYQSAGKDTSVTKEGISKNFIKAMGFDRNVATRKDTSKIAQTQRVAPQSDADQQSAKIEARLAQINKQISQPHRDDYSSPGPDPEVKRLHKMMKTMQGSGGEDPEMKQLNQMLTKIQAIQDPSSLKPAKKKKGEQESAFRAIPAYIDGKQKVVNGGTVRLKLADTVMIKGVKLPKGQLLFGPCQVTNQRLLLTIQNIRIGQKIIPTNLTVFSLDGMPGIPAPEAELQGAAGKGADNAVASMQIMSMDPSIGAQAAAGGINAAKGLFSKKVKTIKVKLKNEFQVLLKINKS